NDYEIADGSIYSLIDIFGYLDQSLPAEIIKRRHFELFSSYRLDTFYAKVVKRVGDVFISLFLLVLTLPITLITVVLVKLTSKGKVFYTQKRVGLKGKEFYIYKFRSMVANAESGKPILAKENDMRVTAVGKVIRAFRIDELPQLFNILIGDMSFIGPRPERKELIEDIIKEVPLFKKRLLVKPGLSGWAQVKYTYVNSIEGMNKKLSYDLYYINNLNIFFDIKILLYTVETIIFRRGAI
ncbi:MAG TPA: sugar transferase, partial [Spirochaetota bacterium]|nr:sugar transferase [Spirochaetota bacterium]